MSAVYAVMLSVCLRFAGDPRYMGTAALSDGDYIHAVMGSAGASSPIAACNVLS